MPHSALQVADASCRDKVKGYRVAEARHWVAVGRPKCNLYTQMERTGRNRCCRGGTPGASTSSVPQKRADVDGWSFIAHGHSRLVSSISRSSRSPVGSTPPESPPHPRPAPRSGTGAAVMDPAPSITCKKSSVIDRAVNGQASLGSTMSTGPNHRTTNSSPHLRPSSGALRAPGCLQWLRTCRCPHPPRRRPRRRPPC